MFKDVPTTRFRERVKRDLDSMNSQTLQPERKSEPARRVGLSRRGYQFPALLSTFHAPVKDNSTPDIMPPKAAKPKPKIHVSKKKGQKQQEVKNDDDDDELIHAQPKESSNEGDSSADERRSKSVDIKPSVFAKKGASKQTSVGKGREAATSSVSRIAGSRSTRSKRGIPSSPQSPKRKIQEDVFSIPSSGDMFGTLHSNKKRKTGASYTSSQMKKRLSLSQAARLEVTHSSDDDDSPQKELKMPDAIATPKQAKPEAVGLVLPGSDCLESPSGTPAGIKPSLSKTMKGLKDVVVDSDDDTGELVLSQLQATDSQFDSPPSKTKKQDPDLAKYYTPLTQAPDFDLDYLDDSGLLSQAREILGKGESDVPGMVQGRTSEDHHFTQTQLPSVCPICHAPIDPEVLKARGPMNTRAQELFCRSHQRQTAKEDWEKRGYPDINWKTLPRRLDKFKKNIVKWINGEDSHYRQQYGARADAGKDRSLKKQSSNLIPGYYGSRGLQVITEYIMQNHTKRLKRVAPKDTLMSKNSVAAYVQAVLVPEVTILLIMEDIGVEEERARDVMDESVLIGELLQEEEKDVHVRRVDDSQDDDSDGRDELA